MGGVPANADILAAYLYWETIAPTSRRSTAPNSAARRSRWRRLATPAHRQHSVLEFRRRIRRDLHDDDVPGRRASAAARRVDVSGNPTGRLLVNDADPEANGSALNTVTLPETAPATRCRPAAGASLFIVYRDAAQPLTSISLYDGIFVQAPGAAMTQTLRGFLQSSASTSPR